VYTNLYFKEGVPQDFTATFDSIIVDNGEIKRQRVAETSFQPFVLTGLQNITVYNDRHQKVAEAKLVRIELFEDILSSEYVAVYKATSFYWSSEMSYYCMNKIPSDYIKNFSHIAYQDPLLVKSLLVKAGKDTTLSWISTHYKVMPGNIIYSVMSCENESMLLESSNDQVKILNEIKDDEHFDSLLPLPFTTGGKPAMLINVSVPETDIFYNYLAEYKDGIYIAANRSRITLFPK
jgi:hypothetical protein